MEATFKPINKTDARFHDDWIVRFCIASDGARCSTKKRINYRDLLFLEQGVGFLENTALNLA